MKKFLAGSLFVFLIGCGGDSTSSDEANAPTPPTPTPPNSSHPDFPASLSIDISAIQSTRSLVISWENVPDLFSFVLCETQSTEADNCKPIKEGSAVSNSVSLQLGVEVSLEQLLQDNLFIMFKDLSNPATDYTYTNVFNLNFTHEIINNLIQYIKSSNTGNRNEFGVSIAMTEDGKTIAIGSSYEDSEDPASPLVKSESGAVYVFNDTNEGWKQEAFLKHPRPSSGDRFGHHVAISANGTILAISVPYDDSDGEDSENNALADSGSVAIYRKEGNTWVFEASIKSAFKVSNMKYGMDSMALSADGKTLAVGHYSGVMGSQEDKNERVELFVKSQDNTWVHLQTIVSGIVAEDDLFGYSLAFDDSASLLAVSAIRDDSNHADNPTNNALIDSGSVHIFNKIGESYQKVKYLKPETPISAQLFGSRVALSASGNILAVGAEGSNHVYLYDLKDNTWTQRYIVAVPDTQKEDKFGHNLLLHKDGTSLIVGTMDATIANGINGDIINSGLGNAGSTYVFRLTDTEYTQEAYLKPIDTNHYDGFSTGMATNGNGRVIAISAPGEDSSATGVNSNGADDNSLSGSGAVYIYYF